MNEKPEDRIKRQSGGDVGIQQISAAGGDYVVCKPGASRYERKMVATYWTPLLSGIAFLLVGWGMTKVDSGLPSWSPYVAFAVAGLLLLLALWLAWRGQTRGQYRLSQKQVRALAEVLRGQEWEPATVIIRYKSGCQDCRAFAEALGDALTSVGWRGEIGTTLDEVEGLTGTHFLVETPSSKPASAVMLASAFRRANLPFQWSVSEPSSPPLVLFVYPKA